MKRLWIHQVIVVLLLVCTGVAQGTVISPYWGRLDGFTNQVVVYGLSKEYYYPYAEIQVRIPQLVGVADQEWQAQFNTELAATIEGFVQEILEIGAEVYAEYGEEAVMPYSGIVDFEVKANQGGLLSLVITYYAFTGGAHGMTYLDYLNYDLTTGHRLQFADFFPTEEELNRVVNVINARIAEEPEWFFIEEFTRSLFNSEQGFYLENEEVVVCFGLYELAPYAAGIQEFSVSAP